MARAAREKSESGLYRVMLRGSGMLFRDEADYEQCRELIGKCLTVYAYALLKGAVCLLLRESENGISADMKPFCVRYARYFNKKYEQEGRLFKGRFKSEPVGEEELPYAAAEIGRLPELMNDGAAEMYYDDGIISAKEYRRLQRGIKRPAGFYSVLFKPAGDSTESKPARQEPEKPVRKKKQMPSWLL